MFDFVVILITFGVFVWLFKIPQVAEFVRVHFPPRKVYETEQQLIERGVPYEIHNVTTDDGYILKIFRLYKALPPTGEVVLLQHGLLSNSTDWVAFDGSIAFQLVDLGWDVWLGNHRGNTYCRSHVELSVSSRAFWEFSFHELGTKDLIAIINHILTTTNARSMVYIGHSQGCTEFFAMASSVPEMNQKIKAMFALSPVCGLRHARSKLPVLYRIAQIDRMGPGRSLLYTLGLRKLLGFEPVQQLFQPFAKIFIDVVLHPITSVLLKDVIVYSNCQFPHPELVANCLEYFLLLRIRNGTSARQIMHFAQSLANDYYFHQMDRGKCANLQVYGQRHPPAYDIFNVTTHVALIWGQDDACAVPRDLIKLHSKLKNKSVLCVPMYKHMDFTCSIVHLDMIMNHIIAITESVSSSNGLSEIDANVPSSSGRGLSPGNTDGPPESSHALE